MSRPHRATLSLTSLALLVALPFAWMACGGGDAKPAENPENDMGDGAAPAASSAGATDEAPASSAAATDTPAPAPAATKDTPPPPPPIGDSDCVKCIEKTCAKQVTACGKNNDCQSALDSFHSCGSDKGAAACMSAATMPTAAKPKKLAAGYMTCAKKAATSKTCKATCK